MTPVHFAFKRAGSVFVLGHTMDSPEDSGWDGYLAALAAVSSVRSFRTLAFSLGGGPTSAQRKRLQSTIAANGAMHRTAIVSEFAVARSIATAISWFNDEVKTFSPTDVSLALDYLALSDGERPLVLQSIVEVKTRVLANPSVRSRWLRGPE